MSIKVAINGFGRIGRCTLRAIYEQGLQNEFEVVAINASGDLATNLLGIVLVVIYVGLMLRYDAVLTALAVVVAAVWLGGATDAGRLWLSRRPANLPDGSARPLSTTWAARARARRCSSSASRC